MKALKCQVIQQWTGIDRSHPSIKSLDDIVSWRVTPPFSKVGRSAWLTLKEPIVVQTTGGDIYIESIKIKGVGYLDYRGNLHQPTTNSLRKIKMHLGISEKVDFFIASGFSGPIGGIVLEKALAEYSTARTLIENGVPSSVPICVYKYDESELCYQVGDQMVPMGVVVTGQLQRTFTRVNSMLYYSASEDVTKIEISQFAERMGVSLNEDPELSLLKACYRNYGRHLPEFSKCGLYRHGAHWSNLGFSSRAGGVYFTDLDSCRELAECSELSKPMQVMRDSLSAVLYLMVGFFTESYLLQNFSPERVIRAEIQQAFLSSYYTDIPIEYINSLVNVLNEYHLYLYKLAIEGGKLLAEKRHHIAPVSTAVSTFQKDHNAGSTLWENPWLNYKELYCWLMAVVWALHTRSQMATLYPFKLTEDEFYTRMSKFSTPQLVEKIAKRIDRAIK